MEKCPKCSKEFRSRQGMLSHVRAIHEGKKAGGNPALLSVDRAQGLAKRAFARAGMNWHGTYRAIMECPNCRQGLISELEKLGYLVIKKSATCGLQRKPLRCSLMKDEAVN